MAGNRRGFLEVSLRTSTLVALGSPRIPLFLEQSARGMVEHGRAGSASNRVLVVVQLLGGNDGLNTVVPHGIDGYVRARKVLRINTSSVVPVSETVGLHPSLGQFGKLLDGGKLAIVQGVGYPNPDRSHFRSMEIWESGRLDPQDLGTGWLGRAVDQLSVGPGGDVPAMHLGGGKRPLALQAMRVEVPSFERLEDFRLRVPVEAGDMERRQLDQIARMDPSGRELNPLLGFVRRSTLAAYDSSSRLERLIQSRARGMTYPNYGLARKLELVAQIIKAGFGTSIYYTTQDGYDTHANQLQTHAGLLNELADSLQAFHADLTASGHGDRVAILVFSEFGRRLAENASAGTDHGAAAPVFLIGPVRKHALIGEHPSLEPGDLDDGDPRFHTDFRRVYADLLQGWMGLRAEPILGPGFDAMDIFA